MRFCFFPGTPYLGVDIIYRFLSAHVESPASLQPRICSSALIPGTSYLAVNIVDRFPSARVVSIANLRSVELDYLLDALYLAVNIIDRFLSAGVVSLRRLIIYRDQEVHSRNTRLENELPKPYPFPSPGRQNRRVQHPDVQARTVAKYFLEIDLVGLLRAGERGLDAELGTLLAVHREFADPNS
ncbi:hypothetical protein EDB89DRAFT_2072015 [Lactarius sanguifluus]|nr:hypothetical protein EDB89DRAFT_2072011 [Lactarius sanguifluus]KAH9170342.1 hypothetical protein EDB89DRAFT_2072015 [Lactarius sanguifluus]